MIAESNDSVQAAIAVILICRAILKSSDGGMLQYSPLWTVEGVLLFGCVVIGCLNIRCRHL